MPLLIYQNFLPNYNNEYSYWEQRQILKKFFSYKYYIKDEK